MANLKKILIWCFLIGELAILPWRKRFDTQYMLYMQVFTECCLGLSLLILLAEFLMRGKAYPRRFIWWLYFFLMFVFFQKLLLRLDYSNLLWGIRSYIKYPLFFLVLVNTFRLAIDYRIIVKFFIFILVISMPLTLFESYVLRWAPDWCGGILPAGEFALFGIFMFLFALSMAVITEKKQYLFMMAGILVIWLTAETKMPFFLLPIGIFILIWITKLKRLISLAMISIVFLMLGVLSSQLIVKKSRLREYFFSPQKAIWYVSLDKTTGKEKDSDNKRYELLADKKKGYSLNRIPSLIFSWREIQDDLRYLLFGKGMGIATPEGDKDSLYVRLAINQVQISKSILEIGIIGVLIYFSLILSQVNFHYKICNRINNSFDKAASIILAPLVICYLLSIFYNQVFMIRGSSLFLWTMIAYRKRIQEDL